MAFLHKNGIKRKIKFYASFTTKLSNINWEEIYKFKSTKKADGKYDVKLKSKTESEISYKLFRFTMKYVSKEEETMTKIHIKNLDFSPFISHLNQISESILEIF